MIDAEFLEATTGLMQPGMGTELMGPLLYQLIRSTRPRRVLEVGIGYTTPFILKALAENSEDFERERRALLEKTRKALLALDRTPSPTRAETARIVNAWLAAEPLLANPEFYLEPYCPKLHAIDNRTHAAPVQEVLDLVARLGFSALLETHISDFRGWTATNRGHPLDLVWFDCGSSTEYLDFLKEYWKFINPNSGYLLLHSTLHSAPLNRVVERLKAGLRGKNGHQFEVLSLLEPHKFHQASATLVRFTGSFRPRILAGETSLTEDLLSLVTSFRAAIDYESVST